MPITTMSSREFNQHTSFAKRTAQQGPVFITDRGKPEHVLLSFEDYQQLLSQRANLVDLLALDDDIDFEPPRLGQHFSHPVDLS